LFTRTVKKLGFKFQREILEYRKDSNEKSDIRDKQSNSQFIFSKRTAESLKISQSLAISEEKGVMVINNSCAQEYLKAYNDKFYSSFIKRRYLHKFTEEGVDEMEFTEAESGLNDSIDEYKNIQDYNGNNSEDYEGEED